MGHATLETVSRPRQSHIGDQESALSAIYREEINISIWQRHLDNDTLSAAEHVIESQPNLQFSAVVKPTEAPEALRLKLGNDEPAAVLSHDMSHLVDMFCFLFDLRAAGIRVGVLNDAMCPRFHVDRVSCRLITTYSGIATQWIPNLNVDRSKLGAGSQGLPDEHSGVYKNKDHIQQLNKGDVALLKGESWTNNQGGGLVHRSPQPPKTQSRLLMTLDFIDHTAT